MDGVERVMVLGILAVIVAILSFAWSATDENATPAAATDSSHVIPLSSSSSKGGGVVMEPPSLNTRLGDPGAVAAQQERAQLQLLGKPQKTQAAGRQNGRVKPILPGTRPSSEASGMQPKAIQDPRLEAQPQAQPQDQVRPQDAGSNRSQVKGVMPSTRLRPAAAKNEERESGSDEPRQRFYTVQRGDTLWGIAYREVRSGDTNRMVELIQELNPGLQPNTLSIGRTVKLPSSAHKPLVNKTPTERVETNGGQVYVVLAGDTLGVIAKRELGDARRWKDVYQLNKATIQDPGRIHPGQRLVLPEK